MIRNVNQTRAAFALVIALSVLPACPPEEEGEQQGQIQPQRHDIKDFWPMAEGNYWHLLPLFGDYEYIYEVLEDYSTEKFEAWAVRYRAYDDQGYIVFNNTVYYIFHEEFFAFVTDKDILIDILNNPGEPLPYNGVTLVGPRFFFEGAEPREYWVSVQGTSKYTIAGPLRDILGDMICPQFDDPIPPEEYPVESNHQSVVTTVDGYCGAEPALRGQALFAKDVGPLQYGGRRLALAVVNGVEYSFEP